jgi:hypothetical protein
MRACDNQARLDQFAETRIIRIKPLLKPCYPFLVTFKTQTKKRWMFLDQFDKTHIIKSFSFS